MEKQESKKWWQSKTLWMNFLGLLGSFLLALHGELLVAGTLTVGAVANIVLRLISKAELK